MHAHGTGAFSRNFQRCCKRPRVPRFGTHVLHLCTLFVFAFAGNGQVGPGRAQPPSLENQQSPAQGERPESAPASDVRAEAELHTGTTLTRQGRFEDAIPHLRAARGHVANEYAASFNLALCYVATRQYKPAIEILQSLRRNAHADANVENLLAQAYIGNGQPQPGFEALQRASVLTPSNEKLYLFVADACMDRHDYGLGLKVADLGLTKLAESAGLHYERAVFLSLLDEFDQAKADFKAAEGLAPGSEISYLAAANENLYAGNPVEAARVAREGVAKGFENPALLIAFGDALLRTGVRPGDSGFKEAETALTNAIAARPLDPNAQALLGKLYLLAEKPGDAIPYLEKARELEPGDASIYATLAKAYQRHGDMQRAQDTLAALAKINQAQAEKIGSAPGDRKASYAGSAQSAAPHRP